jgi:hypothetical protein
VIASRRHAKSVRLPPLNAGQQVHLLLEGGETASAIVERIDEHSILLALVVTAHHPALPGQYRPTTLEFTTARGIARVHGEMAGEDDSGDLLRFRLTGEEEIDQRRQFARVDVARPVALRVIDPERPPEEDQGWVDTYTVNLSGNGLLLAGPESLERGDTIEFRLSLGEGANKVPGRARIVRADYSGTRAATIVKIAADDRERVIHFIFERERISRKLIRGG